MSNNKRPQLTALSSKPNATPIPPSLQAKLAAFQANRSSPNVHSIQKDIGDLSLSGQAMPASTPFKPPTGFMARAARGAAAAKAPTRRPKPAFSLIDIDPSLGGTVGAGTSIAGLGAGRPSHPTSQIPPAAFGTPFANFSKIVDPSGALNFNGKAILNSKGVNFESGASFAINMSQLQLEDEELGKGNYGTVKKVLHKPTNVAMAMKEIRLELDQAKLNAIIMELDVLHRAVAPEIVDFYGAFFIESCVYYCMEYMDAGSLDKLIQPYSPRSASAFPAAPSSSSAPTDTDAPYSFAYPFDDEDLDFDDPQQFHPYNTSFIRNSAHTHNPQPSTYAGGPIPEPILGRIAASMVRGLKFLKDDLNIIHRDVKPTNVLVNRKGQVKLCDFGVSGQLDKSMARTNIGCQSYMAPERIRGESRVVSNITPPDGGGAIGGVIGTAALADELYGAYTVSSDVWSLGLSIIELGLGRYPYPPETYSNVFAQLTAIVHGPPPCLPSGPPPSSLESSYPSPPPSEHSSSSNSSSSSPSPPLLEDIFGRPPPPRLVYSPIARDWVNRCMKKEPLERATYKELLEHPWLRNNAALDVDVERWVRCAVQARTRPIR